MKAVRIPILCLIIGAFHIQCAPKQASWSLEPTRKTADSIYPAIDSQSSYRFFALGRLAELNADPRAAIEFYSKAFSYHPESSFLRLKLAEQWMTAGQIYPAKRLLEEKVMEGNPQYHLLLSKVSIAEMNLDKGISHIDKAIKIFDARNEFNQSREAVLMKVALLSDAQRFGAALETLKKYLKANPRDEIAFYFMGRIYSVHGKAEEAKKAYQEALRLRPHFLAAAKALGLQHELEGKNELAIEAYQQALIMASDDQQLRNKIANLLLIEEKYLAALEHLHFLLESEPSNIALKFRVALIHLKLEQFEPSERLLHELSQDDSLELDRIHFFLASIKEQQGDEQAAIAFYSKIDSKSQYFIEARLKIATLWSERLLDPWESIKSLKRALDQQQHSKELYLHLAHLLEKSNELDDAIHVLKKGTTALPRDEDLLYFFGSLLDRSGDYVGGVAAMRELLRLNPTHAHAMNHIGYVFAERKMNLEEAEELLIKAVQLEPQNAYIIDSLGWLYFQKGKYKKAKEFLERAHRLEPDERIIAEHLGDAYSKLELHDLALKMYKKVVELDQDKNQTSPPDEDWQKRIQAKISSLPNLESLH